MRPTLIVCATTIAVAARATSTGVQKLGPDTYTIGARASGSRGGSITARRVALEDATVFCTNKGQEILVKNWQTGSMPGSAEIIFRCLNSGDSELQQRPEYKSAPNMKIEIQNSN